MFYFVLFCLFCVTGVAFPFRCSIFHYTVALNAIFQVHYFFFTGKANSSCLLVTSLLSFRVLCLNLQSNQTFFY